MLNLVTKLIPSSLNIIAHVTGIFVFHCISILAKKQDGFRGSYTISQITFTYKDAESIGFYTTNLLAQIIFPSPYVILRMPLLLISMLTPDIAEQKQQIQPSVLIHSTKPVSDDLYRKPSAEPSTTYIWWLALQTSPPTKIFMSSLFTNMAQIVTLAELTTLINKGLSQIDNEVQPLVVSKYLNLTLTVVGYQGLFVSMFIDQTLSHEIHDYITATDYPQINVIDQGLPQQLFPGRVYGYVLVPVDLDTSIVVRSVYPQVYLSVYELVNEIDTNQNLLNQKSYSGEILRRKVIPVCVNKNQIHFINIKWSRVRSIGSKQFKF
ncbi:UNKNOWN [Stylonychia lemnae]|uniref:Uncharacterized protein n=1 Tax=Stylonychia lemnae TaxID=5949 RepID=A0A078B7F8_STYLE|nr:UNKNOWN [Stylonychia lemnae]|eukprot:CDW90349.1 UNKNOWN [Stylonychia lemnae]